MSNIVSSSRSRQFTIRSVLGDAVKMLSAHPKLFFGLAFIAWLPGAILALFFPALLIPFSKILINPVNFVMIFLIQGAASIAVFSVLQGRVTDIRTSLSACMNRFASLFALSLIVGLINLPVLVVRGGIKFAMAVSRLGKFYSALRAAADSTTLFGWNTLKDFLFGSSVFNAAHFGVSTLLFLLMLASFFIMCVLYLAAPICTMERSNPVESLKRSAALTLGYRSRIFGLIAVLSFISYCLLCLSSLLLFMSIFYFSLLRHIVIQILMFIPQTFFCLIPPIVYYRLRELKEGVTPAQTAGANTAP